MTNTKNPATNNGPANLPPAPPKTTKPGNPEYRPIPVDCLPEPIKSIVEAASPAFDCDPCFVAVPLLALSTGLIGNSRCIQLKRGFTQPAILWFGVVAKSGSGKSPPFRWATAPVYGIQNRMLSDYERVAEQYEADLRAWESSEKERARKGNEDMAEPKPKKPPQPRLITNDPTIESLFPVLEDNAKGINLVRDELAAFFGNMSRYKASGSDLQAWLEFYEGGTFIVDRRGGDKPVRSIHRASVSITGGIPPGPLQRCLTDEFLDSGLLARFLFAWPPDRKRRWVETEIDFDTQAKWERLIAGLMKLDMDKRPESEGKPIVYGLTQEAKAEWVKWYDFWAGVVSDTANEFMQAAYSKVPGQAARLALVHHVVSCVWAWINDQPFDENAIPLVSLQAGTKLAQWFAREATRVYRASTPESTLIAWIQRQGGKTTPRDLVTAKRFPTAVEAKQALDDLVSSNKGYWDEKEKRQRVFCLLSERRRDEKP